MKGYTALILENDSRATLQKYFRPKYEEFIAHHVTIQFGINNEDVDFSALKIENKHDLPSLVDAYVVGYADSGDGLETLIVSVDGTTTRPDGGTYHITWSLDPDVYKPKNSNDLIQKGWNKLTDSIKIKVDPTFIPFEGLKI